MVEIGVRCADKDIRKACSLIHRCTPIIDEMVMHTQYGIMAFNEKNIHEVCRFMLIFLFGLTSLKCGNFRWTVVMSHLGGMKTLLRLVLCWLAFCRIGILLDTRSSFTDPGGMESWVGLGTTTVSKQSARDRYVTNIVVVSCSHCHASLGKWEWTASPQLLPGVGRPRVEPMASWVASHSANRFLHASLYAFS